MNTLWPRGDTKYILNVNEDTGHYTIAGSDWLALLSNGHFGHFNFRSYNFIVVCSNPNYGKVRNFNSFREA